MWLYQYTKDKKAFAKKYKKIFCYKNGTYYKEDTYL